MLLSIGQLGVKVILVSDVFRLVSLKWKYKNL